MAADRSAATLDGDPVSLTLWANDPDDQLVTWTLGTPPAHGTATIANGAVVYTSDVGYHGTDTLTVIASDGEMSSAPAQVTIAVTARPAADPITASTAEGDAVPVTLHGTSPRGGDLTYEIVAPPSNGTLSGYPPTFTYTPEPGFIGSVTFTYQVADGTLTSRPATVTITVIARPTAVAIDLSSAEGDALAITLAGTSPRGQELTYQIVTPPASGTLSGDLPMLTYTPEPGIVGTVAFTYVTADATAVSHPATVTIEILARPLADDLVISAMEGDPAPLVLHGTSPRGLPLTYQLLTQPAHGIISGDLPSLVFTPTAAFVGTDRCTYMVSDGVADSRAATVSIDILERPTADALSYTTPRDTAVDITLHGSSPRGQALTYQIVTPPSHGTISGGGLPAGTYTPAPGFAGTDTCSYTVTDGAGASRPATVTIVVLPGLPSGWTGQDIGDPGATGSTIQDATTGDLTSIGAGTGVAGTADSGQFASTAIAGDFDAVARIPLPATTAATARVGICVRETTDPGSREVFVGLSGAKKAVWSRRTQLNGTASTSTWSVTAATWVRISRRGNVLWSYRSTDGATWTLCGNVTMNMPNQLLAGSFVASGTAGSALQATVGQFALNRPQAAAPGTISINFQAGKDAPTTLDGVTWLIADGAPFGPRWAGMDYGCSAVTTSTYNRNSALSLDERYDTGLNAATSNVFEVAVPNGTYTVTVCVGDANSPSGKLYPEIEGVRAVTGTSSSANRWFTGTVDVPVTDGRLTLTSATGATATRWAWLQIVPAPVAPTGGG